MRSSIDNHSIGRKSIPDDDDEFIVPDEEDEDEEEVPPSRAASRSSSRLSDYAHTSASEADDGEGEHDESLKRKGKPRKERPAPQPTGASKGGSSDMFLTAAERRARQQKEEKKSTEDPFDFLQDVRDKDGIRPGEPGYDPRTLYIPIKAWKTFTPFEKQVYARAVRHRVVVTNSVYSSGRSSRITTTQCCSSRKASSWSCMRKMLGLAIRNLT